MLYAAAWDPTLRGGSGGQRRTSLRHRDRDRAKAYAAEQYAKLIRGEVAAGRITLGRLLALYDQHEVSRRRSGVQVTNRRQAELFVRFLGADRDPLKITRADWTRLTEERREGRICPHGAREPHKQPWQSCPGPKGTPVRDRTIEADLRYLSTVLRWATLWQDREGRYLLRENPVRGYPIPREKNPRRPVQTPERHEALLEVAERVTIEEIRNRKRVRVRSYLPELLVLANETGRRLSAILGLTYGDLHSERTRHAPHGAITWRAGLDKKGRDWPHVAITSAARAALDRVLRDRPGIGAAPLFPSPRDPSKPMDRHLANRWLRKAEKLAGLEHQPGGGWHTFRRKAATELKGTPDKDVMALLGWSDIQSLKQAYQHADPETMLMALENRRERREAR
jgi:integrase